ncbi:MAG: beta-ketoacyl-ACP synthase [Leptolyngbyaceae cyanobacterium bins.59]|nr:beta-ketoacyl-ACP synthase [Leptolyngbyaceae cyanobacterium bins.59]
MGNLQETWQALREGRSGIQRIQAFPELPSYPLACVGCSPANVQDLIQQATSDALQDAKLSHPLPTCGVVIGSSRSHQAQWEQLAAQKVWKELSGRNSLLSANWLATLPHTPATTVAQHIQTQAPALAPMAACATGLWCLTLGLELLETQQCDRVLVGAVEAPITPLTLAGFQQMGALAQTGSFPFDRQREGLVLGEGAAVLVLESKEMAVQRSARIYGRVLGVGMTADGYHVSAPAPTSDSAKAAIRQCLERSNLTVQDIDYIHAHGTATPLNDRNEAYLIQQLFPKGVPVSSTKGATGHTLGASGALGASFCLMALYHQMLPPCIGLQEPEFDLNLIRTVLPSSVKNALCLSFGFGGQNGVVAFAKN